MFFFSLSALTSITQVDSFNFQVSDEVKYIKTSQSDRTRQLVELNARIEEISSIDLSNMKVLEDEIKNSLSIILASDESRRAAFQLTHEEEQQNVAVCSQVPCLLGHFFFFFLSFQP